MEEADDHDQKERRKNGMKCPLIKVYDEDFCPKISQ
jgi:hypothetical protein